MTDKEMLRLCLNAFDAALDDASAHRFLTEIEPLNVWNRSSQITLLKEMKIRLEQHFEAH